MASSRLLVGLLCIYHLGSNFDLLLEHDQRSNYECIGDIECQKNLKCFVFNRNSFFNKT